MANLLGHKAWNRTPKCKRVNCCTRPRWSKGSVRHQEEDQWEEDAFREEDPEVPEWVALHLKYLKERYG